MDISSSGYILFWFGYRVTDWVAGWLLYYSSQRHFSLTSHGAVRSSGAGVYSTLEKRFVLVVGKEEEEEAEAATKDIQVTSAGRDGHSSVAVGVVAEGIKESN